LGELFPWSARDRFRKIEKSAFRAAKIFTMKQFVAGELIARRARRLRGFCQSAFARFSSAFAVHFICNEPDTKFVCQKILVSMSRKENILRAFCSIFWNAFVISFRHHCAFGIGSAALYL